MMNDLEPPADESVKGQGHGRSKQTTTEELKEIRRCWVRVERTSILPRENGGIRGEDHSAAVRKGGGGKQRGDKKASWSKSREGEQSEEGKNASGMSAGALKSLEG